MDFYFFEGVSEHFCGINLSVNVVNRHFIVVFVVSQVVIGDVY